MAYTFELGKKLQQLAKSSLECQKTLSKAFEQNIEQACEAMEEAAKAATPHEGDGKQRGFNVINNSLQESWKAEYKPTKSKRHFGKITLTNSKYYAAFVQNGHKVKKHFVPWLYKDGMGTLSYETDHNQPVFGLVVGTKTPYVKGVDMVGPAVKAFFSSFDKDTQKVLDKHLNEIFDNK